ncbi:MAG: hypothetical protein SGJ19_21425 [Planctomycetia bacterium]|nr:hypothetical protein [Planctomycetia bacterium]
MRFLATWAALAAISGTFSVASAATFEELLKKSPEGANVAIVVNVAQIMQSEYAKSQGTAEKLAEAFQEREIMIPPNATQFVMVSQLDLERHRPIWEAAIMELSSPPAFVSAASKLNSTVENIAGAQAIGTRRAMLVDLGDSQVGAMLPTNRQLAARWIKRVKSGEGAVSAYLTKASSYSDTAGTDIILSIDLTDVLPQKFLEERLRDGELKDQIKDIPATAALLTSIQGVRLGIKIGDKCHGKLIVDFAEDPSSLGELAKPMLLNAIGGAGIMLEEFADWQPSVGKSTLAIEGDLGPESMRQLMGLVSVPTDSLAAVASESAAAAPKPKTTPVSAMAEASRTYFKTVDKQFTSLQLKHKDAKTFGQVAQWVTNAARRIDRLPTLDVDPEMVAYGASVSTELREMAASLQGIGINSAERNAAIYGGDTYYSGWDGWYYSDSDTGAQRRQVRAEEKAAGARSAREIAVKLENEAAAMRAKMSQKYKLQF